MRGLRVVRCDVENLKSRLEIYMDREGKSKSKSKRSRVESISGFGLKRTHAHFFA